jgi:hypothetical protein
MDVEKYTIKISNAQGIIWQTSTSDNQIILNPVLIPWLFFSCLLPPASCLAFTII